MLWIADFQGLSSDVQCQHNDEVIVNCSSPQAVVAKAFNGSSANNFTVIFTDVCGATVYARYSYSASGVTKISVPNPWSADAGTIPPGSSQNVVKPPKNGAAAVPSGSMPTTLILGLFGALLMVAAL